MTLLRSSPALIRLIADIESRLTHLSAQSSARPHRQTPADREPSDDRRLELEAEIKATQQILSAVKQVDSKESLVGVYHDAVAFIASIAEDLQTIGENEAGIYLRNRISSALDELGIDPSPPPAPGTAPRRSK